MSQTPPVPDRYNPAGFRSGQDSPDLPPRPSRGPKLVQWSIILGVLALVLVPVIWGAWPGELARWHDAAASEKHLNGDLAGALAELDKAFALNDTSAARYRLRAQIRREAQDYQGSLEDFEAALRLTPDQPALLLERATALTHLGRLDEALDLHKQVERMVLEAGASAEGLRASLLNGVAYWRGLANIELAEGLACAEEAVKISGGDTLIWERAGYLHVLRKDWERAKTRLHEAAQMLEKERDLLMQQAGETDDKGVRDGVRERMIALESRLAGVQYYLSEAYRELGHTDKAEEYQNLALAWKKDAGILKNRLLSEAVAYNVAASNAAFTDTRGYVHYRLGNFDQARRDLELAVELAEAEHNYHYDFSNSRERISDLRRYRQEERQSQRNLAVILYHRALVYEKLGLEKEAAADLRRIKEELKFTPDEHLF